MAKDSLSNLQRSASEERHHPRTVTGRGHRQSTRSPERKCEQLPQDLEDTQHSDGTDWYRCLCRFGKGKKVGVAAVARERQRLGEESLSDISGRDTGHQHRGVLLPHMSASERFHPKDLEGRLVSRFGSGLHVFG